MTRLGLMDSGRIHSNLTCCCSANHHDDDSFRLLIFLVVHRNPVVRVSDRFGSSHFPSDQLRRISHRLPGTLPRCGSTLVGKLLRSSAWLRLAFFAFPRCSNRFGMHLQAIVPHRPNRGLPRSGSSTTQGSFAMSPQSDRKRAGVGQRVGR